MGSFAPLRRWFGADPRRADWALTLFVLAVAIVGLIFPTDSIDDRPLDAIGVVIAVVPAFFIPFRRTLPIGMLAAATVLGFTYWVADYPGGGAWPAMAVLLYSAAVYVTNRRHAAAVIIGFTAALLLVLIAGLIFDGEEEITVAAIVVNVVLFELAWIAGDTVRQRREHIAALEARTMRAERDQEQKAALAVSAERARIANELHDILAHSMSIVVVQAEGAKRLVGRDDEAVRDALKAIEDTSRHTLADIRRTVGLRVDAADRAPAPDLSALPALVDTWADAGLDVDLDVQGDARTLPAMIELSAYRIVQESLTNAMKHGGPNASATVTVSYRPDQLALAIADTGRGAAAPSGENGGHGLTGMRERVESFGGTFRTGPRTGGGYLVEATLPVAD